MELIRSGSYEEQFCHVLLKTHEFENFEKFQVSVVDSSVSHSASKSSPDNVVACFTAIFVQFLSHKLGLMHLMVLLCRLTDQ